MEAEIGDVIQLVVESQFISKFLQPEVILERENGVFIGLDVEEIEPDGKGQLIITGVILWIEEEDII